MNSNFIYAYCIDTVTENGETYIGYTDITYKFLWNLFKQMVKNSIMNILYNYNIHIKMWSISDDKQNYNIYFENYNK